LIGLMHGHFDAMDMTKDGIVADDGIERMPVNMGIAIVVPAEKIREVINSFLEEEEPMIEDIRRNRQI